MYTPGYYVWYLTNRYYRQRVLTPVMNLTSSLIAVRHHKQGDPVGYGGIWTSSRDTKIGVVAMGYGDGYPCDVPEAYACLFKWPSCTNCWAVCQ